MGSAGEVPGGESGRDAPPGRSPSADPQLRASDADRDRVAQILGEHCAAGRLDMEEYSQRLSVVLEARTLPELFAVLADLPHPDAVVPSRTGYRRGKRWRLRS